MEDFTGRRREITSVQLRELPPQTTLVVTTSHSSYRVVVIDGSDVRVQGGSYFPEPVVVILGSRSADGTVLLPARIEVGLRMAISLGALHVLTSPVRAITDDGSETELAELCAMTRHEATRLVDWGA